MNALQWLAFLLDLYKTIGGQIKDTADAAVQTGELTAEQHAEFVAHMDGEASRPEWVPEKVIPPGPPGPPDKG